MYLTSPKIVKFHVEHLVIKQVACGDAHSIALTSSLFKISVSICLAGQVYGWGYTNCG